jgi:hypothetical protein
MLAEGAIMWQTEIASNPAGSTQGQLVNDFEGSCKALAAL